MKLKNANYLILSSLLSVTLILGSCVTLKDLTYIQSKSDQANSDILKNITGLSVTPSEYKIMPFDNLFLRVITPDPQWSQIFNPMPVVQGGAVSEEGAALYGYTVDINGNIEIPYVGKVYVAGKTLEEIRVNLDSIFVKYVTDAAITVKLVNNYITILGEVNAPGRYRLTKDVINLFDAFSLAGDLSEFGNRQKIQLIRQTPNGPVTKEFSLADRKVLFSEYYYIMPNDILYAMPMKVKTFNLNSPFWIIFLNTITSAFGVIAFFRTQ